MLLRKFSTHAEDSAAKAQKIQLDLKSEFQIISPPQNYLEIQHGTLPGLVNTTYKTDLSYENLRAHYHNELTRHGWRFLREDKIKYDGRDYGGKQLIYCKGSYAADVQYAGLQETEFGWKYSFALSFGLFDECK